MAPVGNAEARLKYYRYNDNIPMVEMSLNMMVAMGVLEPIPSRLVHDGNPYSRYAGARYDRYSRSPYLGRASTRYLGRSRFYDDYWDEPIRPYRRYARSRYDYLSDPWDSYRGDYWDIPWASRWGDPWYSSWDSPGADRWGGSRYPGLGISRYGGWGSPWDSYGYSPWSSAWNNPWYTGGLNPWSTLLMTNPYGYQGSWPSIQGNSVLPVVPDSLLGDEYLNINPYRNEELPQERPQRSGITGQKTAWSVRQPGGGYKRITAPGGKHRNRDYQHLNGLWIDDNGEMLGIRGERFLWNDKNRYAKGQLIKSPTTMEARIKETRTIVRFQYRIHGEQMVIMSRDGKMRTFHRMPLIESQLASAQPQASYSNYRPDKAHLHVRYSRYRSGPEPSALGYPQADRRSSDDVRSKHTRYGSDSPYSRLSWQTPPIKAVRVAYPHQASAVESRSTPISTGIGRLPAPDSDDNAQKGSEAAATVNKEAVDTEQLSGGPQQDLASRQEAENAPALPEGADANDPYSYLYSYLKDPALKNDSEVAASEGEDPGAENRHSNIWRPNELFPHRRRNPSAGGNAQSANTSDADPAWAQHSPWN